MLYPLGIASEMALVYKSIPQAKKIDERLEYVGYAILAIYFPGEWIALILDQNHTNYVDRCLYTVHAHDGSATKSCERKGEVYMIETMV